jgi:Ca2+-binding RTX toxin-like protein
MRPLLASFAAAACALALLSTPKVLPATAAGSPTCAGLVATVVGTDRRDRLLGTAGDDVIAGLDGDDVIRGGAGHDVICGGPGGDRLVGADGDDDLRGGHGADHVSGNGGADRVAGGAGNDDIRDSLVLSADQAIDGGPGRNRITIAQVSDDPVLPRIVIDLAAGTATFPSAGVTFPFAGARSLTSYLRALTWSGTGAADKLVADPTFDPRAGALFADGRGGDDRIFGTERADVIDGGRGHDYANGFAGADDCTSIEESHSC